MLYNEEENYMKLSNNVYDVLKFIAQIVLPALATLWAALGKIGLASGDGDHGHHLRGGYVPGRPARDQLHAVRKTGKTAA